MKRTIGLIGTALAIGTAKAPEPPAMRGAGKDQPYMQFYAPTCQQKVKGQGERE